MQKEKLWRVFQFDYYYNFSVNKQFDIILIEVKIL